MIDDIQDNKAADTAHKEGVVDASGIPQACNALNSTSQLCVPSGFGFPGGTLVYAGMDPAASHGDRTVCTVVKFRNGSSILIPLNLSSDDE